MNAVLGSPGAGNRDLVVIGASAGGVDALRALVGALPRDFPASVHVVVHRGQEGRALLAAILSASGPLPAVMATEGQRIERGRIYVAPPDRHLLIEGDHLHVRRGPRENRVRPAIDPLFRSAAACCTTRVIGVVLTGMLNDGSSGLLAVKRCGGLALVQDPREAAFPDMPRSAIAHVEVDHVLPIRGLAALLPALAASPRPEPVDVPEEIRIEALIAAQELTVLPDPATPPLGRLSPLTCPECHGAMSEIRESGLLRFRCHTGHAFTLETLRGAYSEAWERTLYAALRSQQEQEMLARRLAEEATEHGQARLAESFERRAKDYEEGAELIRRLLAQGNGGAFEPTPSGEPSAPGDGPAPPP